MKQLAINEGRLLQEINHPNIVKCFEMFEQTAVDPNVYLVMELMKCSLNDVLNIAGDLDEY